MLSSRNCCGKQISTKSVVEIGRFDPPSKPCSKCGNLKRDLKLSDRVYHCDLCGLTTDRDLNAAINIRRMGLIKVGLVRPESTPAELLRACAGCPHGQMSLAESGSLGLS